jgi:hypothetical protein
MFDGVRLRSRKLGCIDATEGGPRSGLAAGLLPLFSHHEYREATPAERPLQSRLARSVIGHRASRSRGCATVRELGKSQIARYGSLPALVELSPEHIVSTTFSHELKPEFIRPIIRIRRVWIRIRGQLDASVAIVTGQALFAATMETAAPMSGLRKTFGTCSPSWTAMCRKSPPGWMC